MELSIEVTPRCLYAEYGRSLVIRPAADEDTATPFETVCGEFENTKIEQDSAGNVYIIAPAGGESSYRNSELTMQLLQWAKRDRRGWAFDASVYSSCRIAPGSVRTQPGLLMKSWLHFPKRTGKSSCASFRTSWSN